jgi:glycosyltransferase involved in cell wall biosynthesis
MAEVKKRRIVIASVLKPVNDTRMAEKIGLSLSGTRQFEVHIIGYQAPAPGPDLFVHPLPPFRRLSLSRLLIPWKIMRTIRTVRPALLIITTHELLIPAMLLKLFYRIRVVYDVQENYYLNILHTPAFSRLLRPFIALYVRLKEHITAPAVDHFFLAERGYAGELSFPRNRFTVLENKLRLPLALPPVERDTWQLLFSGTLAETTGVFQAIEIAVALNRLEPRISLLLIGYAAQQHVLQQIKKNIAPYPFITLVGGNNLVPHESILSAIRSSGAGIISYPDNASTRNSIPTKLFEYMGLRLPIILINHAPWREFCAPFQAACVYDSGAVNAQKLLYAIKNQHFYAKEPELVFWRSEEPRLIRLVLHLLN